MPDPAGSSRPSAPTDPTGSLPALGDVVGAALAVGAAVARTVAQATSPAPLPPVGNAPLQDIVRFGSTAAGNVIRLVIDGARAGGTGAPVPAGAAPASHRQDAGADGPRVTAGSTLRVPLLVENTGSTASAEVSFRALSVRRVDQQPGESPESEAVDPGQVAFAPESLVIGPKDFEKLTVRIATTPETAPGRYALTVDGGDGWFSTSIVFDVVR